jgi:glucokinase
VLGGGVSLMDDSLWIDPIRRIVDARVFPPFRGTFEIVTASLGESVVLHGALALAAD